MLWNSIFDWDTERWRDKAACRHTDADLFFPVGSTGGAIEQIQAAKVVCRSCPVQDDCLRFALETNQETGIWGGKDETERHGLRRVWREDRRAPMRSAIV